MTVPPAAIEAAAEAIAPLGVGASPTEYARAALEAALPYLHTEWEAVADEQQRIVDDLRMMASAHPLGDAQTELMDFANSIAHRMGERT